MKRSRRREVQIACLGEAVDRVVGGEDRILQKLIEELRTQRRVGGIGIRAARW